MRMRLLVFLLLSNFAMAAPRLTITGAASQRTLHAEGQDVEIDGAQHRIVITGTVGHLEVTGSGNHVTVDNARSVEVTGVGNAVLYKAAKPVMNITGVGNSCEAAPQH